jgi:hypothetical protein
MSRPESAGADRRNVRWLGLVAVLIVLGAAISSAVTHTTGLRGVPPGRQVPVFAVPLVRGDVSGDANIATHANDGEAGRVPACSVRGAGVLNVCELYERGPLVLALFVDAGSCPSVLAEMQRLVGAYAGVEFAAVAIEGGRAPLRRLLARDGVSFPVGIDSDGVLASLYGVASCPQVTLVDRGGVVQSPALLGQPSLRTLRMRVRELVSASHARESTRRPG